MSFPFEIPSTSTAFRPDESYSIYSRPPSPPEERQYDYGNTFPYQINPYERSFHENLGSPALLSTPTFFGYSVGVPQVLCDELYITPNSEASILASEEHLHQHTVEPANTSSLKNGDRLTTPLEVCTKRRRTTAASKTTSNKKEKWKPMRCSWLACRHPRTFKRKCDYNRHLKTHTKVLRGPLEEIIIPERGLSDEAINLRRDADGIKYNSDTPNQIAAENLALETQRPERETQAVQGSVQPGSKIHGRSTSPASSGVLHKGNNLNETATSPTPNSGVGGLNLSSQNLSECSDFESSWDEVRKHLDASAESCYSPWSDDFEIDFEPIGEGYKSLDPFRSCLALRLLEAFGTREGTGNSCAVVDSGQASSSQSGSSPIGSYGRRSQPSANGKKRRIDDGDEGTNDGQEQSKKPSFCDLKAKEDTRLLACPYHKRDPRKYRSCSQHVLREINRVK